MREIDIIINGRRADTYRDESMSLNFNSSLLGDISSITCSVSQTITLPRTATNDAIFSMAIYPSADSEARGVYMPCALRVDGVSIFEDGQCHLLDSSEEEYSIAVTWGTMHTLGSWVTAKRKLRELTAYKTDNIPWNNRAGVTNPGGGLSQIEREDTDVSSYAMYYANYNVGVNLDSVGRDKQNISPCVTLLEVWERIRRENGLQMVLDDNIRDDMERNVIVLTKNNNTSLQTLERELVIQEKPYYIAPGLENDEKRIQLNVLNSDFFNVQTSSFVHNGYRKVTLTIGEIYLSLPVVAGVGEGGADFKTAALASRYDYALVIKPANQSVIVVNPSDTLYDNTVVYRVNRTIEVEMSEEDNGKDAVQVYVKIKRWQTLNAAVFYFAFMSSLNGVINNTAYDFGGWTIPLRDALKFSRGAGLLSYVSYTYENNNNDYPLGSFALVPNLPDITQIDFVNMICKLYGLFPVADGQSVRFVRFDVLQDNIASGNTEDWSSKHISAGDTPNGIAFDLDGYARHNYLKYKEDKTDPTDYKGDITSENDVISLERTFYEFPLAASKGNFIRQFYLNEAGEVQKNDSEYRLMRMYSDSTLSFDDSLKPQQIVNRHYQSLQSVARRPIVIEDEFLLNELDLRSLDYTKPVYLAKYGRYYAVISIQWSSDKKASKAKLLQLR